jgi:hypothetical protein
MSQARIASTAHVLAFAEIKVAISEFEEGKLNLLEAIERIKNTIEITNRDISSKKQVA